MIRFVSFNFDKVFAWENKYTELKKYGNGTVQAGYGLELLTGEVFPKKNGSRDIRLGVREFNEANFINLFGLFIDTKSLDIAFGYFPDENSYIYLNKEGFGGFFERIVLFGNRNTDDKDKFNTDDIDYKYILEVLKIHTLAEAREIIYDYLKEYFSKVEYVPGSEYNSLVLNLVHAYETKVDNVMFASEKSFLNKEVFDVRFYTLVEDLYNAGQSLNSLAKFFLWPFIAEDDYISMRDDRIKDSKNILKDSLESRKASLERTYEIYLSKGVPPEFIKACVSYGLGIKNRENIYKVELRPFSYYHNKDVDKRWDLLGKVSEKISSMSYVVDQSSYGSKGDSVLSLCFNIIDLVRAIGWLNSLLYSVDMIKIYKNRTLYDSIMDKMKIREILEDRLIDEVDFVKALNKYIEFYDLYSSGSMYKMKVKNKFNFASFTSRQLDNIGPVLDSSVRLILKKFPKDG